MNQVLFWIPIKTDWTPQGIPIYGFGLMLFLAFVISTYLAGRRAERQGIPGERMQDLILWIFLGGLIGGRLFYMIQYRHQIANPLTEFFQIWNGGIVFYGSAAGGFVGYLIARRLMPRFNVSAWRIGDILAPSVAIGLALGRLGCLLNGCCYGNAAPPGMPAIHFPTMTAPSRDFVRLYQTSTGFAMDPKAKDPRTVGAVEPDSPAARSGIQAGDVIVGVDGRAVDDYYDLVRALTDEWPRGKKDVSFTVRRDRAEEVIGPYIPRTIGLNPTQIYESISMLLLFGVLVCLYPVRQFDGQVLAVLMLAYAVHRYCNELLRHDTPTYFLGLTVSQEISILIFAGGVIIWLLRRHSPVAPRTDPAVEPGQA